MRRRETLIHIRTTDEGALQQGAEAIATMLSDLESSLAKRRQRTCIICQEEEWMDPGETICWRCGRCSAALKTLSQPLTKRSPAEHRALYEVVTWMEDVPQGRERSPQEIQNRLETVRASYTWSHGKQQTKQEMYQDQVSSLLMLALYDMNLFFRRLKVVRGYFAVTVTTKEQEADHLTLVGDATPSATT